MYLYISIKSGINLKIAFYRIRRRQSLNFTPTSNTGYYHDCCRLQGTIRRGTRCSTAKAFLRPARLRPNLHIAMQAHVTKIIVNPVTNQVTGVQLLRDGRMQLIHAKREVILSAGSIGSPQLLMLSGIGPGEHLQRMGIPVLQNLRVGDNLQDHVGMFGLTFIVDKPVAIVQNRLRVNILCPFALHVLSTIIFIIIMIFWLKIYSDFNSNNFEDARFKLKTRIKICKTEPSNRLCSYKQLQNITIEPFRFMPANS